MTNGILGGCAKSDLEELVTQVVTLDQQKILYHLQSKHTPSKSFRRSKVDSCKAPLIPKLPVPTNTTSRTSREKHGLAEVTRIVTILQQAFVELEGMLTSRADTQQDVQVLISIVKNAHILATHADLERLLEFLPKSIKSNPHNKLKMIMKLGKIGRYYSTCEFLLAAAKKRKIFRSIKVEISQVQSPTTNTVSQSVTRSTLRDTLARILPQASPIERTLIPFFETRSGHSFEVEERRFLAMMDDKCRIHAEMKLLFFYELRPDKVRPRVISSSKSACFLCDQFVRMHGQFYTPRTHGVLYHQWKLPGQATIAMLPISQQQTLTAILLRFSTAIENVIRSKVNSSRMVRLHPNESVLLHTSNWSMSDLSRRSYLAHEAKVASAKEITDTLSAVDVAEDTSQFSKNTENTDSDRIRSNSTNPSGIESIHYVPVATTKSTDLLNIPMLLLEARSPLPDVPSKQPTVDPKQTLAQSIIPKTPSIGEFGGYGDGQPDPITKSKPAVVISPNIPAKASGPPPPAQELSCKRLTIERETPLIRPTTSNLSPPDNSSSARPQLVTSLHKVTTSLAPPELLIHPSTAPISSPPNPSPYIPIPRSTTLSFPLPARLSTKHIHLSLSSTTLIKTIPTSSSPILVNVTWLAKEALPADGAQVLSIDDLPIGLDKVLRDGAACSEKELWLARRTDVVGIKYLVANAEPG